MAAEVIHHHRNLLVRWNGSGRGKGNGGGERETKRKESRGSHFLSCLSVYPPIGAHDYYEIFKKLYYI